VGGEGDFEEPRVARRMTVLAAALWSLGMGILASLLMEATEQARPGAELDLVNITACRVVATSAFVFLILRVYAPQASVRDMLGMRSVSAVASLLGAAAGALLYPGLSLIDDAVYKRYPLAAEKSELLDKLIEATSRGERLVLFVSFVLVIPLCEELFFRGVLFRALRRGRQEGLAVLASALLYALTRGDLRVIPTGILLGLLVSWLRGRSGSVVPSVLAHVAMNAVPLVPIVLGKGEVPMGGRVAIGGAIGAAICAWGAAVIFGRSERAEEGRLLDG
jgi:membrane protease YdiL (CAAX protease family)